MVGDVSLYPNSSKIYLVYLAIYTACTTAINSASVEIATTVSYFLDWYGTTAPPNVILNPVVYHLIFRSFSRTASPTHPNSNGSEG